MDQYTICLKTTLLLGFKKCDVLQPGYISETIGGPFCRREKEATRRVTSESDWSRS